MPNNQVRTEVLAQGGIITSSGAVRSLTATVTSSRSPISFHYVGRALDLMIYSGMVNPDTDPYVITEDGNRYHRVWARCKTDWEVNTRWKCSNHATPTNYLNEHCDL